MILKNKHKHFLENLLRVSKTTKFFFEFLNSEEKKYIKNGYINYLDVVPDF